MCTSPKLEGVPKASIDLWHKRLGHPSEKVMRQLSCMSPSSISSCNNDGCDVCFRANQPRTSYPRSDSRVSRIFELLHCDLWDPY